MKFTTPCFVRVDNAGEREKLLDWCYTEIGYTRVDIPLSEIDGPLVICDEEGAGTVHYPADFANGDFIDCGTDVRLFKALAALNDENDNGQLFVNDLGIWFQCDEGATKATFWSLDEYSEKHFARKATAAEIIKHFKNK